MCSCTGEQTAEMGLGRLLAPALGSLNFRALLTQITYQSLVLLNLNCKLLSLNLPLLTRMLIQFALLLELVLKSLYL